MAGLVGQTFGGHRLVAPLGTGSSAELYEALHPQHGRTAVKVFYSHLTSSPDFSGRARQTLGVVAGLHHAHVLPVYDFGEADRRHFLAMELATGGSMRGLIQRYGQADRAMPLELAVDLIAQAADGVAAVHGRGILFGNLKPESMLLLPGPGAGRAMPGAGAAAAMAGGPAPGPGNPDAGQPAAAGSVPGNGRPTLKVADAGQRALLESTAMTVGGQTMGVPAYLSPEQCEWAGIDARSDLYSLGLVLYEATTGYLPFEIASIADAMQKHLTVTPPPPRSLRPAIPEALEQVILRCLAKKPADRYPSAEALALALRGVSAQLEPPAVVLAPRAAPAAQGDRRHASDPYRPADPHRPADPRYAANPRHAADPFRPADPRHAADPFRPADPRHAADPRRAPDLWHEADPRRAPDPRYAAGPPLPSAWIRVLDDDGRELQRVALEPGSLVVGRQPDSRVLLASEQVSRQHLRIERDGAGVTVVDLGGSNGTWLEGVRLAPHVPDRWQARQLLQVGPFWLELELEEEPPSGLRSSSGALQSSSGALQSSSGALQSSSGALQSSSGGLRSSSGALQSSSGAPQSSSGALQSSSGALQSSSGAPQSSSGGLRSSSGALQSSSGALQSSSGGLQSSSGGLLSSSGGLQSSPGAPQSSSGVPRPSPGAALPVGPPMRIAIVLERDSLTLTPGQLLVLRATFKNLGSIVEQPTVTVEGLPAGWVTVPPEPLQLNPSQQVSVSIQVHVPRTSAGRAAEYPVTVRVLPGDPARPVEQGETLARWTVLPFSAASIDADPTRAKGSTQARYLLRIQNQGNALARYGLTARDAENALRCRFDPAIVQVDPGAQGQSTLSVETGPHWLGQTRLHAVQVQSTPEDGGAPQALEVQFLQRPRIPLWVVPLALLLVAGGIFLLLRPAPPAAPMVNLFSVEPGRAVFRSGATVRLAWDVQNADAVNIEPGVGTAGPVGSRDLPVPRADTTYVLVAKSAGGEVRREAPVTIQTPICTVVAEAGLELFSGPGEAYAPAIARMAREAKLTPLSRSPDGAWLEASDPESGRGGWVRSGQQFLACNIDRMELPAGAVKPLIEFYADRKSVAKGRTVTVSWKVYNAREVYLDGALVKLEGSKRLVIEQGVTYELRVVHAGGEEMRQVTVAVEEAPAGAAGAGASTAAVDAPAKTETWTHRLALEPGVWTWHLVPGTAGKILAAAEWTPPQSALKLLFKDPLDTPLLKRGLKTLFPNQSEEGKSPLDATFTVRKEQLEAKAESTVSVIAGAERVEGNIRFSYPGAGVSATIDRFAMGQGNAASTSLLVVKKAGTIEVRAEWIGSPATLPLSIFGPGQADYYARRQGPSPLTVSYAVTTADLKRGDLWRVLLGGSGPAGATGNVSITHP